ncbi:molybdopterin synthase catalytic subunit MoaE [Methylosoma difficile]
MAVIIRTEAFDPWQVLPLYEQANLHHAGKIGATSVFVGTMRDFNDGDSVTAMHLEYYPGMTEKQLQKIIDQAAQQWQIVDAFIVHRVGDILPSQPIVLVAVWTSHRGDAFDASRFIMEALKSQAPFWKKERLLTDAERWVLKNTDGYQRQGQQHV